MEQASCNYYVVEVWEYGFWRAIIRTQTASAAIKKYKSSIELFPAVRFSVNGYPAQESIADDVGPQQRQIVPSPTFANLFREADAFEGGKDEALRNLVLTQGYAFDVALLRGLLQKANFSEAFIQFLLHESRDLGTYPYFERDTICTNASRFYELFWPNRPEAHRVFPLDMRSIPWREAFLRSFIEEEAAKRGLQRAAMYVHSLQDELQVVRPGDLKTKRVLLHLWDRIMALNSAVSLLDSNRNLQGASNVKEALRTCTEILNKKSFSSC